MNKLINIFYPFYLLFLLSACGVGSISTDFGATDVEVTETDSPGDTAVISLSWTPPDEYIDNSLINDKLTGYNIYFGTSPDPSELEPLDLNPPVGPNLTSIVIENDPRLLRGNTYYFGMTAFDSNNVESAMSEIVKLESAK